MVMMMMVMTMMRMRMVMVIMSMCGGIKDGWNDVQVGWGVGGAKSISCQHLPANPRGQVTNEMFSMESKVWTTEHNPTRWISPACYLVGVLYINILWENILKNIHIYSLSFPLFSYEVRSPLIPFLVNTFPLILAQIGVKSQMRSDVQSGETPPPSVFSFVIHI